MGKLIAMTILSALLISSSSSAESADKAERILLARAETRDSSDSIFMKADEKINGTFERESVENANPSNGDPDNALPEILSHSKSGNVSRDVSSLIKNELNLERDLDLEYKAPRLKAEQLPLIISSKDRKTKGVVLPPFLYFKKQF